MAAWATVRNKSFDWNWSGTSNAPKNRAKMMLCWIWYELSTKAGWTHVGTGLGTSKTKTWGGVCPLPSPDSFTLNTEMGDGAWVIMQNADGVQVALQVGRSGLTGLAQGNQMWMRWSPSNYYTDTGNADTLPVSPADEVAHSIAINASNVGVTSTYLSFRRNLAYTTDGTSFILFGGGYSQTMICLVKLEDYQVGDSVPYWSYFNAESGLSRAKVVMPSQWTYLGMGWHPSGTAREYGLSEVIGNYTLSSRYLMDYIGADPVSGEAIRIECMAVCMVDQFWHVRGKVPGVQRVPSNLPDGTLLVHAGAGVYDWVILGDYCLPWKSSDSFLV